MKHFAENAILAACIIIVAAFLLLWLLMGCASKQSAFQIELIKGCSIRTQAVSSKQAVKLAQDLEFRDCEVIGRDTAESEKQ